MVFQQVMRECGECAHRVRACVGVCALRNHNKNSITRRSFNFFSKHNSDTTNHFCIPIFISLLFGFHATHTERQVLLHCFLNASRWPLPIPTHTRGQETSFRSYSMALRVEPGRSSPCSCQWLGLSLRRALSKSVLRELNQCEGYVLGVIVR